MSDRVIKLDTAKLASEKGFSLHGEDSGCYLLKNDQFFPSTYNLAKYDVGVGREFTKFIYAPTQTTLQTWLREEHKIDVFAYSVRFQGYVEIGYYTFTVRGVNPVKNYRFETYEEALEVGLTTGLKEIGTELGKI